MSWNRRDLARYAVASFVAIAGLLAVPAALAQVPGVPVPALPEAPPLPPEVTDAMEQGQDLLVPVLVDAAYQAQPGVAAVGFAVRPACSAGSLALVLVAMSGAGLPLNPSPYMKPVFIACGGSYMDGPADMVFGQVDAAAGEQLEDAVQPGLDQVHDGIQPIRPNLNEVCGAVAAIGTAPSQVPAPLNRFNMIDVLCG